MAEPITLLINRTDITPYAQVALHAREDDTLHSHILASQNVDIRPVLGDVFWTDIVNNYLNPNYKTLLDGGTYVNSDGNTVTFQGLKASIACFTYARYILHKNAVDTPYGMVAKVSEYSEQTDSKLIISIASEKRNEGGLYLQDTITYLRENVSLYPLYGNKCNTLSANKFIHKLTPASKI
jgi:hypothetical protein